MTALRTLFLALTLMCVNGIFAQQYVTTLGLQYKPILASSFFRSGSIQALGPRLNFTAEAVSGSSIGMVVRRGIDKRFSFETGINLVNRNYQLNGQSADTTVSFSSRFKWVSYEIPVQMLVYARFSEKFYLNAAGGLSFDFFPSDVESFDKDLLYYHRSYRKSWIKTALIANVGTEYRTEKSGYFYIGASYHLAFTDMATTQLRYNAKVPQQILDGNLNGSYLTLDFRYFFHENPTKYSDSQKRKIQKNAFKKKPRND